MKNISIITPVYNNVATINDCLNSVYKQKGVRIEHIIIDGMSTDGTKDYINKYNVKFISEPDEGIYDAMNKGVKMATGDIVGILNSDDMYYDEQSLEKIITAFEKYDTDIVFGNIVCVDQDDTNKIIRDYKVNAYDEKMFKAGGHPPHPAFFVKKKIYDEYGVFSLKYKVSSDYEFMLRILEKNKIKSVHINEYIVKMRVGGVSNNSLKSIIRNNIECRDAWVENGLKPPFALVLRKPLSKIKQLIAKRQDG